MVRHGVTVSLTLRDMLGHPALRSKFDRSPMALAIPGNVIAAIGWLALPVIFWHIANFGSYYATYARWARQSA